MVLLYFTSICEQFDSLRASLVSVNNARRTEFLRQDALPSYHILRCQVGFIINSGPLPALVWVHYFLPVTITACNILFQAQRRSSEKLAEREGTDVIFSIFRRSIHFGRVINVYFSWMEGFMHLAIQTLLHKEVWHFEKAIKKYKRCLILRFAIHFFMASFIVKVYFIDLNNKWHMHNQIQYYYYLVDSLFPCTYLCLRFMICVNWTML